MKKQKRNIQIGLGASSILMIFVVLCMMILSVLSYTRALQSEKIAQREKKYQEAYYKTDQQASIVYETMKTLSDEKTTLKDIMGMKEIQMLNKLYQLKSTYVKDEVHIKLHIIEHQYLAIQLVKNGHDIEIKQWKLVTTGGE